MIKNLRLLVILMLACLPCAISGMNLESKARGKKAVPKQASLLEGIEARIAQKNKEKMTALGLDGVPSGTMKELLEVDKREKELFARLREDLVGEHAGCDFKKHFGMLDAQTRARMATMHTRYSNDNGADCSFIQHKDHGAIDEDETGGAEDLALAMHNPYKRKLLHYAAIFCISSDIKLLLACDPNPSALDAKKNAPLFYAITAFDSKSVGLLIQELPSLLMPIQGRNDVLACLADQAHVDREERHIKLMQGHMQSVIATLYAQRDKYSLEDITHSIGNALALALEHETYNSTTIALLMKDMPNLLKPIKYIDKKKRDALSCLVMLAQNDVEAETIESIRDHIRLFIERIQKDPQYSKLAITKSLGAALNIATMQEHHIVPEIKDALKKYHATAVLECAAQETAKKKASSSAAGDRDHKKDIEASTAHQTSPAAAKEAVPTPKLSKKERAELKAAREKKEEEERIARLKLREQQLKDASTSSEMTEKTAASHNTQDTNPHDNKPAENPAAAQALHDDNAESHHLVKSFENVLEQQRLLALMHSKRSVQGRAAGKPNVYSKREKNKSKKKSLSATQSANQKPKKPQETEAERLDREAHENLYSAMNEKWLAQQKLAQAARDEEARLKAEKDKLDAIQAQKKQEAQLAQIALQEKIDKEKVQKEQEAQERDDAEMAARGTAVSDYFIQLIEKNGWLHQPQSLQDAKQPSSNK